MHFDRIGGLISRETLRMTSALQGYAGPTEAIPCIEGELEGAAFGDARLSARLVSIGARLAASRGAGLPKSIGDDSQLECAYRFFSNRRVMPHRMLAPHIRQTFLRIAKVREALAVHDTTELEFGGERRGLGPLSSGSRKGLFLHPTLAVAADGTRLPLGLLGARFWTRPESSPGRNKKKKKLNGQASTRRAERESTRWHEQVQAAEDAKPDGVSLIHVADRETDSFGMFQAVQGRRYVLRANHDRRVFAGDEPTRLRTALERAAVIYCFEVGVPARKMKKQPGAEKTHPERKSARVAKVSARGLHLELREPYARNGTTLPINVVQVVELEPPVGADRIEWILYTSEPVDTAEEIQWVIDTYRARWVIEEFFKALKTGCAVQNLQLETYEALRNAVALHLPIAWQLLLLRSVGRAQPDAPAEQVLTETQLQVLRTLGRRPLSARPTVGEAKIAIAVLGGYLVTKAKGPPGWITLGRGMHTLLSLEQGWIAGQAAARANGGGDPLEQ